ncbi:MAG TPA: cytochrome c family protein [Alphaproteobacteria bacterium]|nr:cytochrome c family protein [Alphaproteobacteria bacterium]
MRRTERAITTPAPLSALTMQVQLPGSAVPAVGAAIAAILLCALPAAAGDPARGEQLWRKCASCHTLDANGRNRAGPRLHGIFGRVAGSVPDYSYSEALKKSGIVWDDATLDAYLKDAEAFVPGTKMYGGLSQDADREDLLAFLKSATAR